MKIDVEQCLENLKGSPIGFPIRVDRTTAKNWLMENKSLICGGTIFYLLIKNLGMGVYSVEKAPLAQRDTKMSK